jgi:hypothetical protein
MMPWSVGFAQSWENKVQTIAFGVNLGCVSDSMLLGRRRVTYDKSSTPTM